MRLGATKDPNVVTLQEALNAAWKSHANYPLVLDGILGPKTCGAAYGYQEATLEISSEELTPEFFDSLDLEGESWNAQYGDACVPWAGGGGTTTGGGSQGNPKVKQLQSALNTKFSAHPNYPLAVDGKLGPKTCGAAYGYMQTKLGYGGSDLTPAFFTSLGLPSSYANEIGSGCIPWYSGAIEEGGGESKPFPWMETLVGAAGGSLIGLAGKKTLLKKSKIKTWHAGVGGAILGAIGGFIAGKMRS